MNSNDSRPNIEETLPLNSAAIDYVGFDNKRSSDEPVLLQPLTKFEWFFGRDFPFFLDLVTDHTCSRLRNALMVCINMLFVSFRFSLVLV
jgi:hypothetical protein